MPVLERATGIVAGSGGGANTNSTTIATTPAIPINSGDVAIAVSYVSVTLTQFSPSSPSNPVWQQRFLASLSPFFVYLWTLENPVPANEPISFTRPTAGAGLALAQVYGGVGRIANVVQDTVLGTANPALSPLVTTTVPGSMVVGAFVFNRGSAQSFLPSGQTIAFIAPGGTIVFADQTVATPSNAQTAITYATTQPTGVNYVSATVVLEPATVTPPVPPGSIPAIRNQIVQWRLQAQQNKIYLMPPAQRAAALAQLKALAVELKQAQIAQRGG